MYGVGVGREVQGVGEGEGGVEEEYHQGDDKEGADEYVEVEDY